MRSLLSLSGVATLALPSLLAAQGVMPPPGPNQTHSPAVDCSKPRDNEMGWMCFGDDQCGIIDNILQPASETWDAMCADLAINFFTGWWQILQHEDPASYPHSFAEAIGYFWGGRNGNGGARAPLSYRCDVLGDSCQEPVKCGTTQFAALDMVLMSSNNIHRLYKKMYDALDGAHISLANHASNLAQTFIEPEKASALEIFKKAMEVFDTILTVAGAGIWENILKKSFFDQFTKALEKAEDVKSGVETALSTYESIAGEEKTEFEKEMANAQKLEDATDFMINQTRHAIDTYLTNIFKGDDAGNKQLLAAMKSGLFLRDAAGAISELTFLDTIRNAMTGQLIQAAWAMGTRQYPVVVWAEGDVDNPAKAAHPNTYGDFVPDDVAAAARLPWNGNTLWLLAAPDSSRGDVASVLTTPHGFDAVAEDGNEWGVTWRQMATSSFEGWVLNDRKNPFGLPALDRLGGGDPAGDNFLPMQQGPATPGYFNFPVCNVELAIQNWVTAVQIEGVYKPTCDWFPCCENDLASVS